MSEQDDLFGKEAEENEDGLDRVASMSADATGETDIAGSGIATGEVRAVEPPAQKGRTSLLLGVLVLLVLAGGGYYLLDNNASKVTLGLASGEKSAPKRYAIEKKVEVEVVEQQQVVSVDSVNVAETADASAAETEVVDVEKPVSIAETQAAVAEEVSSPLLDKKVPEEQPAKVAETAQYQVLVGPYLSKTAARKAQQQLAALGYDAEMTRGRGKVTMIRLLEGIYEKAESSKRLAVVRKVVKDAFKMPVGDKWAIYVGSFNDRDRAARYVSQLAGEGVLVTLVPSEVELDGRMLSIEQIDKDSAQQVVKQVSAAGLSARQVRK